MSLGLEGTVPLQKGAAQEVWHQARAYALDANVPESASQCMYCTAQKGQRMQYYKAACSVIFACAYARPWTSTSSRLFMSKARKQLQGMKDFMTTEQLYTE